MTLNTLGIITGLAAFFGIWLGHVSVRKIEAVSPDLRLPVALALALGLVLCLASLAAPAKALSALLGILGITVLWDAYELVRQEKRVRRGHAPANPRNPRHAAFLAAGGATTLDLLKRDPVGRRVSTKEAMDLVRGDALTSSPSPKVGGELELPLPMVEGLGVKEEMQE